MNHHVEQKTLRSFQRGNIRAAVDLLPPPSPPYRFTSHERTSTLSKSSASLGGVKPSRSTRTLIKVFHVVELSLSLSYTQNKEQWWAEDGWKTFQGGAANAVYSQEMTTLQFLRRSAGCQLPLGPGRDLMSGHLGGRGNRRCRRLFVFIGRIIQHDRRNIGQYRNTGHVRPADGRRSGHVTLVQSAGGRLSRQ